MPKISDWIASLFKFHSTSEADISKINSASWKMPLVEAVREAHTLLAFASRRGITLDQERMKTIIEMDRLFDNNNETTPIDEEKEEAFWGAYSSVVAKIYPVTSDSINATLGIRHTSLGRGLGKRTIAQQTVLKYGLYSLVVLLAIIYFQSYMQMGMSVRNHLMSSFNSQNQAIDSLFANKIADEDNRLKAAGKEGQDNVVKRLYERYIIELQLAKLRACQDEIVSWDKIGGKVLVGLGMSTGIQKQGQPKEFTSLLPQGSALSAVNQTESPTPNPIKPAPAQPEPSGQGQIAQGKPSLEPAQPPRADDSLEDSIILDELKSVVIPTYLDLNESEQTLRLISEFVLPLLYGLLGACAYILRDLTSAIRSVTFSKSSLINYNLRLIMGPLVGIAVGLFLGSTSSATFHEPSLTSNPAQPATLSDISSLSTVALAFLAGYSVEVLFSALDALVGAFARKKPTKE